MLSELTAISEGGIVNMVVPFLSSLAWLSVVGYLAVFKFPSKKTKYSVIYDCSAVLCRSRVKQDKKVLRTAYAWHPPIDRSLNPQVRSYN